MKEWDWEPRNKMGIWRYGAGWVRSILSAMPYLTIGLLLLMFHFIGGSFATKGGMLFALPEEKPAEGENPELVALIVPLSHDIMVFFDDARYLLGEPSSMHTFGENLASRLESSANKTLLVMADRRVPSGELMNFAEIARHSGVERLLVSERKSSGNALE